MWGMQKSATEQTSAPGLFSQITTGSPRTAPLLAHARMGSGGIYVAPVTVGDGAYSGAGALIRKDVPAGALAISEFSQRNIEGWVLKNREGTEPAAAAQAANGAGDH